MHVVYSVSAILKKQAFTKTGCTALAYRARHGRENRKPNESYGYICRRRESNPHGVAPGGF